MRSLLPILIVFALSGVALAADSPSITIWAGAGGYVRGDCIAPVFVQLQNDTTDRQGYVAVRFSSLGSTVAEARRDFPLPPNSQMDLFLYVPNMGRSPDHVTVTYHDARGRRINSITEKLRSVPPWRPVVAAVGTVPGGLPPYETDKGETLHTRLFIDLERMPDDSIGLEMFDAIIISPPPVTALKTPQVEALRQWVLRGGTLVVDASERTNLFTQGTLVDLIPFVPQRLATVDLTNLETEETITEGRLQHSAQVLFESDGYPLVVRRNYGLGSIAAFAISPDARGMKQWTGRPSLWRELLGGARLPTGLRNANLTEIPEEKRREIMMNQVRTNQQTGLRLGLVLILTIVYALVVGPGDYLFIKWLGKPKMTWITFPAIVLVFTVAAWWGAKAWVGGDMTSMHMRKTIIFPELGTATQHDLMGVFVPAGRRYTINHQDGFHIQQIRSTLDPSEAGVYDGDRSEIEQRIPIWKPRIYDSTAEVQAYPQVDLLIDVSKDPPVATISNQTDRTLRGNHLVRRGHVWRIRAEIPPGEKLEWELDPEQARPRAGGAPEADWLTRIAFNEDEHWAHARQFNLTDALRRGAYVFMSDDAGPSTNSLVVDGELREEPGRASIHVVTYPRDVQ